MPNVSIVTCTYNRGALLKETIASVLDQRYQDFEYIIVDDGSDDDTASMVASFADKRIQYVFHSRTGGHLSVLRNFAETYCHGRYVAYVDSDDLWEPTKLERQIEAMEASPQIGFSFTDIVTFDDSGVLRPSLYQKQGSYSGNVFEKMLRNELIICHTTLVIRRSCLLQVGPMDESLHSGDHDRVFFLSRFFDAFILYEPLVRVRKHQGNTTGSNTLSLRLLKEHHQTLNKLQEQQLISASDYKRAMIITSYSFGMQAMQMTEWAVARSYFKQCLSYQIMHPKALFRLLALLTK
ncbi:MAG TPA: glycosyltransferase [Cyclobacteriaceae bacterium]|nr:glycosyltransferase [Cyclobacteriaceae bacterium]